MALLRGVSHGYHATGAFNALTYPAGTAAGDLLVAVIADRYLPSLGTGWITRFFGSGTEQSGRVSTKLVSPADAAVGGENYILANAGTGEWAVLCFYAGSFDPAHPIPDILTDLTPNGNVETDWLPIKTGRGLISFASLRMSTEGNLFADRGTQVFDSDDVTDTAGMYIQLAASETTLSQKWSTSAVVSGAFKTVFTVSDAVGTLYLPPFTTKSKWLVAAFAVAPITPEANDVVPETQPILRVFADGSVSPFRIQFQVSETADFATLTWSVELTGRTKGTSSTTVGAALNEGTTYYWRARAGDGTTWGPWSAAVNFYVDGGTRRGIEELYINIGVDGGVMSSLAVEYGYTNVGIYAEVSPVAFEWHYENVGFQVTRKDTGIEYLYEEVLVMIPTPHVWFTWREYGFVEDHIFVYGQGFGTLQAEFNASILFDWGPDFSVPDVSAAVFDWSVQPAGPHAYDALRHIDKGTDITLPTTTVETDIVEIIIPTAVAPPFEAGAQHDLVYVLHDGGPSNKVVFLLYPTVPVPMGLPLTAIRSANKMRMSPMPPDLTALIELHRTPVLAPYMVIGNGPTRTPTLLGVSSATAEVGTWSVTENLQAALDVELSPTGRWLADPDTLVARPDLGTGVLAWEPSQGDTDILWTMYSDEAGYIDPLYALPSRNGLITRPAFVLPGLKWMGTTGMVDDGIGGTTVGYTIAFAAVLHAPNNPRGQIITSYVPGGQPVNTYPVELDIASDVLSVQIGGRLATQRTTHLSGRAVIVVMGVRNDGYGALLVVDETAQNMTFQHPPMAPAANQRIYLARPEVIGVQDQSARMDILDLSLYYYVLGPNAMLNVANQLDSIYGVSR